MSRVALASGEVQDPRDQHFGISQETRFGEGGERLRIPGRIAGDHHQGMFRTPFFGSEGNSGQAQQAQGSGDRQNAPRPHEEEIEVREGAPEPEREHRQSHLSKGRDHVSFRTGGKIDDHGPSPQPFLPLQFHKQRVEARIRHRPIERLRNDEAEGQARPFEVPLATKSRRRQVAPRFCHQGEDGILQAVEARFHVDGFQRVRNDRPEAERPAASGAPAGRPPIMGARAQEPNTTP